MRRLTILLIVIICVACIFGVLAPRAYAWNIAAPGGTVTYSISASYQAPEIPAPSVALLGSPALTDLTVNLSPEVTGVTDWVLLNPSLSPAAPNVGDPVTFHVTLAALSTNQPYPQSVTLLTQIDSSIVGGGTVDYPGPTGTLMDLYSTLPWTATAGAHTVTWKATSESQDPNTSNNQVSLSFSVGQVSQQFDFTLSVSPSERTVKGSGIATYTVTVNRISGISQTVTLGLIGEPPGVTGAFSKGSAKPTFSSSLTLTVAQSTSVGSYTLAVIGSGGGKTRSTTLSLSVIQQPDFNVRVSPSSLTVIQSQVVSFLVEVSDQQNFNSPVSLSVSGLPQGSNAVFSANSGTPNYSSIMTLDLTGNVQTGSFTLTIRAQGGGLTRTAQISLNIISALQTQTLTETEMQTTTQTRTETSTYTQTQTETRTVTSYASQDLLAIVQNNGPIIIGMLLLIIILLAAAALRRRRPDEGAQGLKSSDKSEDHSS